MLYFHLRKEGERERERERDSKVMDSTDLSISSKNLIMKKKEKQAGETNGQVRWQLSQGGTPYINPDGVDQ